MKEIRYKTRRISISFKVNWMERRKQKIQPLKCGITKLSIFHCVWNLIGNEVCFSTHTRDNFKLTIIQLWNRRCLSTLVSIFVIVCEWRIFEALQMLFKNQNLIQFINWNVETVVDTVVRLILQLWVWQKVESTSKIEYWSNGWNWQDFLCRIKFILIYCSQLVNVHLNVNWIRNEKRCFEKFDN